MTTEDFKQLEQLLGKLGGHLGHRFCIVPNCVHEGYHIGLYDDNGDIKASDTWTDLETTTKRVIEKIPTNTQSY